MLSADQMSHFFAAGSKGRLREIRAWELRTSRKILGKVSRLLSAVQRKIEQRTSLLEQGDSRMVDHTRGVVASTRYNMRQAPGEDYYRSQYWNFCKDFLPALDSPSSDIVDLGCGQGRFVFSLAAHYPHARIVGVDISKDAIVNAQQFATVNSIENTVFHVANLRDYVDALPPESLDLVLYTEVALFEPDWRYQLEKIVARLKTGGVVVASFRSAYFNALLLVAEGRIEDAIQVVTSDAGQLWDENPIHFSWTDSSKLRSEFSKLDCEVLKLASIGACSGIEGDPHAQIAQVSRLTKAQQVSLMHLEIALGEQLPDAGRYILVVARKKLP
jgi:2-polyprenyl-3-methyl-5-hydroxy-6-metoxy-1,4-benzoquinol methylase